MVQVSQMLKIIAVACLLPAALTGCPGITGTSQPCYPVSTCTNALIAEYASLHQLKLSLDAADQAPIVVMQPTPVIVQPNPTVQPPVIVTPVVPGIPGAPIPSPIVGTGVPQFPSGPVLTPSTRKRRVSRRFDDNPPASAASLNAAQLSQLTLAAAAQ
jgi:hypothetical protein